MRSEEQAWRDLLDNLIHYEWGQGYRLVIKRIEVANVKKMSDTQQWLEASKSFPEVVDVEMQPSRNNGSPFEDDELEDELMFKLEELEMETARINNGKAPEPDSVLPVIAKGDRRGYFST